MPTPAEQRIEARVQQAAKAAGVATPSETSYRTGTQLDPQQLRNQIAYVRNQGRVAQAARAAGVATPADINRSGKAGLSTQGLKSQVKSLRAEGRAKRRLSRA